MLLSLCNNHILFIFMFGYRDLWFQIYDIIKMSVNTHFMTRKERISKAQDIALEERGFDYIENVHDANGYVEESVLSVENMKNIVCTMKTWEHDIKRALGLTPSALFIIFCIRGHLV